MLTLFVSLIALVCSSHNRKKVPLNYILLGIFTICESLSIGSLTAMIEPVSVLVSIGAFLLVTGGLWLAALNTKLNSELMAGFCKAIVVSVILQFILMIVLFTLGLGDWELLTFSCLGVLISGCYILFDLLKIMTPDVVSFDDYILGALNLYIDLVRLFIYLLRIFASAKK